MSLPKLREQSKLKKQTINENVRLSAVEASKK
jgi:hypothetical protein